MRKTYNAVKTMSLLLVGLSMLPVAEAARAAEDVTGDVNQDLFLQAMKDRADGNLYDATAAFNNILSNNPQLHRARLELAVTYRRLYDYANAKKLAQEVLDDPATPPNVRVTVQAFLVQLDVDAKEMQTASGHSFKPEVGIGWFNDSNVTAGPSSDYFGPGITLAPGSQPHSDTAAIINAGLNHQYRTGKSVKVGQSDAILLWQDYVGYNRRDYTNEHAFDLDVLTMSTGPALIAMHNWRANLSVQADYIRQSDQDLAWFLSLLPSITKQFANDAWEITLDGGITKRDYQQDVDSDYDSTYYTGQFSVGYTFLKAKISLQAGTSAYREDADVNYNSYDGFGVYGGAAWRLWSSGSIFGRVSERTMDFDAPDPFWNFDSRNDRVRQYTVGTSYTLKSSQKFLNDMTLAATFVRSDNFSNTPIHEYDRQQSTVMLSKAF
jgi:tetratricopeptide (TPR) repeat protein